MLKLLLIVANYPLRASLFKIGNYNHKDIRRGSKLRFTEFYLEKKLACVVRGTYFPLIICIHSFNKHLEIYLW